MADGKNLRNMPHMIADRGVEHAPDGAVLGKFGRRFREGGETNSFDTNRWAEMREQREAGREREMEARLAKTKDKSQALGEIAGFAAEAATLAAIAAAFDQADALDATPAAEIAKPHRTHGRQSVAMPFFSFAPRG